MTTPLSFEHEKIGNDYKAVAQAYADRAKVQKDIIDQLMHRKASNDEPFDFALCRRCTCYGLKKWGETCGVCGSFACLECFQMFGDIVVCSESCIVRIEEMDQIPWYKIKK